MLIRAKSNTKYLRIFLVTLNLVVCVVNKNVQRSFSTNIHHGAMLLIFDNDIELNEIFSITLTYLLH